MQGLPVSSDCRPRSLCHSASDRESTHRFLVPADSEMRWKTVTGRDSTALVLTWMETLEVQ